MATRASAAVRQRRPKEKAKQRLAGRYPSTRTIHNISWASTVRLPRH